MRVYAPILPDAYPKFTLLKTATKVQKIFDIRKFSGNFFQKKIIYSFSNNFPNGKRTKHSSNFTHPFKNIKKY